MSLRWGTAARRWALFLGLFGGAFGMAEAATTNRPGALMPMTVQLGSIEASAPNGCVVTYTAQVVTGVGEQPETFEIEVADDGAVVQIVPLQAPADGALHVLSGAFHLDFYPAQTSPGIGLYLVDEGRILDAVDPLGVPCSAPDVPALAGTGFLALGGVLVLVALMALRRRARRAGAVGATV